MRVHGVWALALGLAVACTQRGSDEPPVGPTLEPVTYECRDPALVQPASDYAFEIDGERRWSSFDSLQGRPGTVAAGDVIRVAGIPLVIGAPGYYRFAVKNEGRRVELSVDRGPWRLAGLRASTPEQLDRLPEATRQGLMGVRLMAASDDWGLALARLPLERVAVAYARMDAMSGAQRLLDASHVPPGLPEGLRYLEVEGGGLGRHQLNDADRGMAQLEGLTRLRYLVLRVSSGSMDPVDFDVAWLADMKSLHFLRLDPFGRSVAHIEQLGGLEQLRGLDLSGVRGLDTVDFVSSLPALRYLDIHDTEVFDLWPTSAHPALETIEADGARVGRLPVSPPPRLRSLSLMSTWLPREAIEAFAQRVPQARVAHRWNQALADVAACADRIRVRTGGLCHRDPERERTLFEVTDAAAVARALPLLRVVEDEPKGTCMCCGEPTVELYRGGRQVAAMGIHHGKSLRWRQWPSDGTMADPTGLCAWLRAHGAPDACERS